MNKESLKNRELAEGSYLRIIQLRKEIDERLSYRKPNYVIINKLRNELKYLLKDIK